MFIHAKTSNGSEIVSLVSHPTQSTISGYITLKQEQIDQVTGNITIGSSVVPYETFVKYCHQFKTDANGTISFKDGVTINNLSNGALTSLDMSVPLSFTRANTIVNFGRL